MSNKFIGPTFGYSMNQHLYWYEFRLMTMMSLMTVDWFDWFLWKVLTLVHYQLRLDSLTGQDVFQGLDELLLRCLHVSVQLCKNSSELLIASVFHL